MARHRPPDHHGYRGLVDHFITDNRGWRHPRTGRKVQRTFGRRMLRAGIPLCDKCLAADMRDARLRHLHGTTAADPRCAFDLKEN